MTTKKWNIIILIFFISLSCDENFFMIDCQDCLATEPTDANVTVDIEKDDDFRTTIMIYEGNIGENILLSTFHDVKGKLSYKLTVNKIYTFVAEYLDYGGVKYTALSSVYPRVRLDLEQCSDFPCYYIFDNRVNLELRYH